MKRVSALFLPFCRVNIQPQYSLSKIIVEHNGIKFNAPEICFLSKEIAETLQVKEPEIEHFILKEDAIAKPPDVSAAANSRKSLYTFLISLLL